MTPEFYLYLALCLAVGLCLIPYGIKVSREHREALESYQRFCESTEVSNG